MKDASYNFKYFQAFKLKFKHFSDFDNNITKILAFSRISSTHANPALYIGEKSKKIKECKCTYFISFIHHLLTNHNQPWCVRQWDSHLHNGWRGRHLTKRHRNKMINSMVPCRCTLNTKYTVLEF